MPRPSPLAHSSDRSVADKLRGLGLFVVLVAGAVFFAVFVSKFLRIDAWLFWRYAAYWVAALLWASSCLCVGHVLLARVFRISLQDVEKLTLSFALGVLAFGLAVFFLGLVHGLNQVTFFALPAVFVAMGARPVAEDLTKLLRRSWVGSTLTLNLGAVPVVVLGTLAVAFLYFQQLWPEVFSFDVRWYHIPMAQRYALSGAVSPFPEGFWPQAFPHLLTYHYAWAFLMPGTILFDRVELCSHLEFVLFLATLAQIPVFVQRVVPGARAGVTWTALLAFPCIYLYDGNLHAGADHAAGFWAIPIALTMWRAWHAFTAPNAALLATFVSAAALTKYTALPLAATAGIATFARGLWVVARDRSAASLRALGVLVVTAAAVSAPHWLKNWIWFGDPVYPMLHKHLAVHPWNPDALPQIEMLEGTARPGSLTARGLADALRATMTFSFIPNDWSFLHRDVPVFGSLFTLTLPALPFLRGARRLWWAYLWVMSVVFCWYVLSHYDRYLQAVVPAMAAATAACLVLCWRSGVAARAAVVGLVGLQLIWAGDVPFIRTHNQVFDSPVRHVSLFLASAFEQKKNRLRLYEPLGAVGEALPENAKVLAHDVIMILGIDRNWVTDLHQSRFSYARLRNPAAIHAELTSLGVTHLVWPDGSIGRDSLAGDLAFANYAARYTTGRRRVEWFTVAALPGQAPSENDADYQVANLGCGQPYARGWFRLSQLAVPVTSSGPYPSPERPLIDNDEAAQADLIVVDGGCNSGWTPPSQFVAAFKRGNNQLYVRARSGPLNSGP